MSKIMLLHSTYSGVPFQSKSCLHYDEFANFSMQSQEMMELGLFPRQSPTALFLPMCMLYVNYSLKFTLGTITSITNSSLTQIADFVSNTNGLWDGEKSFLPSALKSLSGKGLFS